MRSPCFDVQMETLRRDQLRRVQDHRLRWQVRRCYDGSPWYRARFEAAGATPDTFDGIEDLARIPLLTPEAFAEAAAGNEAATVAPLAWLVAAEHVAGLPTRSLTYGDLVHQSDQVARALWAAALRQEQAVNLPDGLPGQLAALLAERLSRAGCQVGSPGSSLVSIRLAADYIRMDSAPSALEPLQVLSVSFNGWALAHECRERAGLHWAEDHFLAEAIDPVTGVAAPAGSSGELVITDLTREASPLIRFRTGLETTLIDEPCPCGRTSRRSPYVRRLA